MGGRIVRVVRERMEVKVFKFSLRLWRFWFWKRPLLLPPARSCWRRLWIDGSMSSSLLSSAAVGCCRILDEFVSPSSECVVRFKNGEPVDLDGTLFKRHPPRILLP